MIVIGIDPDSDKHGVAIYEDSELKKLCKWDIMDFIVFIGRVIEKEDISLNDVFVHIEDVNSMSAVFRQRQAKANWNTHAKMANNVGKCQQSQIEIQRVIESFGIKITKHKISKAWKKDKALFEKVTGWKGQSNEDTRSAAYFGYLGLNKS